MKGAKANILETIGNTPIVRLNRIGSEFSCHLHAKLEYFNPGLSIKDRIGFVMIEEAEKRGEIRPGGTIVESTSGNTGTGLALAAIVKGYSTVFVMPDKVSDEKVRHLRAFGSKVITCPTAVEPTDPRSYYSVARRIAQETPNAIYVNQYDNMDNPLAHYRQTGPEIWEQTGGEVDTIVLGIGTGGTVSGIGKYLKERKPGVKMIGVDPVGSIYYEYWKTGKVGEAHTYLIEGVGEDIIPGAIQNLKYVDEVVQVSDEEGYEMTRRLVKDEAIFVGVSSGAAVAAALKYAARARPGENIIVLLPDSGVKYLSKAFNEDWLREHGLIKPRGMQATAASLVAGRVDKVLTAARRSRVADVVHTMQERGVSRVPVVDAGRIVGVVTESELLQGLVGRSVGAEDPVEKIMSTRFAVVTPGETLANLLPAVRDADIAIVMDGEAITGVITKIDLITYLTDSLQ